MGFVLVLAEVIRASTGVPKVKYINGRDLESTEYIENVIGRLKEK